MKKFLFLILFLLGSIGVSNAKTTVSIEMYGRVYTQTIEQNISSSFDGQTFYMDGYEPGGEYETMGFAFPIYYYGDDGYGHGWVVGGGGVTLEDIIVFLIAIFF
ncbi:hypothetical protein [Fluviicola sp.]|uniref:hypothetical protein n=1 Tax=Fluviicola sp. TaxID=1917219 RepID=UPI0031E34425